jgi:hypothetical protein
MSKWLSVWSLAVTLTLAQSGLAPTEVWSTLTGACCYPDVSCADGLTRTECEAQGGTYMGDETACISVECVPEPQGACCYPDGSCGDDLTQAECGAQGGTYMGDEITCAQVECGSDVKDEGWSRDKPSEFTLFQNHPNPFNQTTKIEFSLANSGFVSLSIYDPLGRKVRTLASERLASGYKSVLWDGKNDSGEDVASGIYFYRIKVEDPADGGVGDFSQIKKLVLLK